MEDGAVRRVGAALCALLTAPSSGLTALRAGQFLMAPHWQFPALGRAPSGGTGPKCGTGHAGIGLGAGVGFAVHLLESLDAGVGVDLRRRDGGVAEEFLDGAEVGARVEHMGGECVAQ